MNRYGLWGIVLPALIAVAILGGAARLHAAATPGSDVQAEMLADTTAVAPGKPFMAAIILTTRPGWHIYWTNPGDGGMPTHFDFDLPAGFKAELMPFPLPHKFDMPGGIVNYGYSGRTVFLARISPPTALPESGVRPLRMTASWLSCNKDQCVPGSAKPELTLSLGDAAPANTELFAGALQALPQDGAANAAATISALYAEAGGAADRYRLQIGWQAPVKEVEVFPEAVEGLQFEVKESVTSDDNPADGPLSELSRRLAATSRVSIAAHIMGGQQLKVSSLPVWIVYTAGDGKRRGFITQVDLRALGARASK